MVFRTEKGTPYLKEPIVEVVSHPNFRINGVHNFLNNFDNGFDNYCNDDWDSLEDGTALCKLAGQTCYASFGEKRTKNDNVDRYFYNIFNSGHGCYDEETEVLTINGWKHWKEVSIDDHFATLNKDGSLEYHKPKGLISKNYSGKMYKVDAPGVDLLVTPNHNMLVNITSTKSGRKNRNFSLIRAEDLNEKSCRYKRDAEWHYLGSKYPSSILKLLGFSIGDGSINGNFIKFHLHKDRKIDYLKTLSSNVITDGTDSYKIEIPLEYKKLFNDIYNNKEKVIPQYLFNCCSKQELECLYEGLINSDGCVTPTGVLYDTTSEVLSGQIQQLVLHIGLASSISQANCYKNRTSSLGNKPIYRVYIINRSKTPEINKCYSSKGKSCWINNWNGVVYCAEVPNNTLFVRRNGKAVWCGNSVLEHANYSFLIYGVSRSLTHELVRHRAGVGVSQLSQRYVSGKVLRFVERAEYQNDPFLHQAFCDRIDIAAKNYEEMSEYLLKKQQDGDVILSSEHKTDLRKKVQQTARSVLPNETETFLIFTTNARALRHILESRGSMHAEIEIRRLAVELLQAVRSVTDDCGVCELFKDYVIIDAPDGTQCIDNLYQKV